MLEQAAESSKVSNLAAELLAKSPPPPKDLCAYFVSPLGTDHRPSGQYFSHVEDNFFKNFNLIIFF